MVEVEVPKKEVPKKKMYYLYAGIFCAFVFVVVLFLALTGYYHLIVVNETNETNGLTVNNTELIQGVERNVTMGLIFNILMSTNNCSAFTISYQNFTRQLVDVECLKLVLNNTRG